MADIGVAISGGGHRAALFGLGALLYLVDAKKNAHVRAVSSVSGGSMTNGYIAWKRNFRAMDSANFEESIQPLLCRIARRGTLWGWWGTWLYLLVVIAMLGGAIGVWSVAGSNLCRALATAALLIGAGILLHFRGNVCGRAFRATLFSGTPKLSDIADPEIEHVMCTTDMHAGEHVYFSGSFVCSYRFGWGRSADLPLHVAIQSSAAFPFGFAPRWLRTKRFQFHSGTQADAKWMTCCDGGVYDNMADQWFAGLASRKRRDGWQEAANLHEPEEEIVVNGAKNLAWTSRWSFLLPWIGEVLALKAVIDVTYDNTTTYRRKGLVEQFDAAARAQQGMRGALVMIEQSPRQVATFYARNPKDWPERAQRANAVLQLLDAVPANEWATLAAHNANVPTTLRALGTERSANLLYHGYVLAMANLHVILDYPLLTLPCRDRFLRLVK